MSWLGTVVEVLASGAATVVALGPGGDVRVEQPLATAGHPIVRVTDRVAIRSRPDGPVVGGLRTRTRFGSPTVVAVVEERGPWLRVLTPSRRDPAAAWVRRSDRLRTDSASIRLTADLSEGRLTARTIGGTTRVFGFRSGRPASPTPVGTYGVTDRIDGSAYGGTYGRHVIALSGHQPDAPAGWAGGTRLAIHGRPGGGPATPSFGCLVVSAAALRWLASHLPLGTVVRVRA